MVEALISKGADVNFTTSEHGTPLHYASYLDRRDFAQALIQSGAQVEKVVNGYTPAELAKLHDNMDMCNFLMEASKSAMPPTKLQG